jgi:hypothetical protein
LLTALGAGNSNLDPLFDSGNLSSRDGRQPIVLCLFAWLTTFRFVLQTFVVKKDLLAGRPNERLVAVYAVDRSILKLGRLLNCDLLRPAG